MSSDDYWFEQRYADAAFAAGAPAGLPLHEATDRDGDNVPSDRVRAYAEAIRTGAVEISQDEARMLAPRVMAVADREQAALHYERDVACNSINRQRVEEVARLQSHLDDALHPVGGLRERLDILKRELTEQERDTATQLRLRLEAEARIARVESLHQPISVPAIPGTTYLTAFTRCSCTPGLIYDDCPTAAALRGPEPTEEP